MVDPSTRIGLWEVSSKRESDRKAKKRPGSRAKKDNISLAKGGS